MVPSAAPSAEAFRERYFGGLRGLLRWLLYAGHGPVLSTETLSVKKMKNVKFERSEYNHPWNRHRWNGKISE
jgi:hypothetical protein